jgi:hypothetical protein
MLRIKRNPEHPERIPGGGIIANTSSEVVTASSIRLPTTRIPTRVTGRARRVRTPSAVPTQFDATPANAVHSAELLQQASLTPGQPHNTTLLELPLQVVTEAGSP